MDTEFHMVQELLIILFFQIKQICKDIYSKDLWMNPHQPLHLLNLTFEQCCLLDAAGPAEGQLLR